jgi:hypothetical protein
MPVKVRIIDRMKITDITPEWIRLRARTKGVGLGQLAKQIGMERTKLSKSLNGKRTFLTWELEKIEELLGEAEAHNQMDPDLMAMMQEYLALSGPDRLRARVLMRALLSAEALEGKPAAQSEPEG